MENIKILLDKDGAPFELVDKGNGRVELRCQHFPEITHTYAESFIQSAIQAGLLIVLPEKLYPQQLKMGGS